MMLLRSLRAAVLMIALAWPSAAAAAPESERPPLPPIAPPDCKAPVGYDRNMVLPGYLLPTKLGPNTCIPFTTTAAHPPAGYQGDFYVDEFSDAKLRQKWAACQVDPTCNERVQKQVDKRHPPNREYNIRDPGEIYLYGKITQPDPVDLKLVRRPAFFARAPYDEAIANLDDRISTVEFTAPPDAYDRLHAGMSADVRLRGWYIRGAGVSDGHGGRKRALVIWSGGGSDRVAGIDDPSDHLYHLDADGKVVLNPVFSATTGASGSRYWRQTWVMLNAAGFDVLAFDRRGVGVSSGYTDTNTLQQGRDLLNAVADLRTGRGLRILTPQGQAITGRNAAASLRGAPPAAGLPVFLLGSSRGTMADSWAMTMNFDKECGYDQPVVTCAPARHDDAIKGVMLVAEFSGGVGYVPEQTTPEDDSRGLGRDRALFTVATEEELNIDFFTNSGPLAGIHTWPSALFGRGLWCYAESLEGTIDSYSRVRGLKELVVVRGPHAFETWPEEERQRLRQRMIAYATAVLFNKDHIDGGRPWSTMKELVATASDVWEPSSDPQRWANKP